MNKKLLVILYVASLILYVIAIGFISKISITSSAINETYKLEENKIQFGQSASVGVERHRWYGTIIESVSEQSSFSKLYLFNLISLPIKKNNTGFVIWHLVFLFLVTDILIFILLKGGKNGI